MNHLNLLLKIALVVITIWVRQHFAFSGAICEIELDLTKALQQSIQSLWNINNSAEFDASHGPLTKNISCVSCVFITSPVRQHVAFWEPIREVELDSKRSDKYDDQLVYC